MNKACSVLFTNDKNLHNNIIMHNRNLHYQTDSSFLFVCHLQQYRIRCISNCLGVFTDKSLNNAKQ